MHDGMVGEGFVGVGHDGECSEAPDLELGAT